MYQSQFRPAIRGRRDISQQHNQYPSVRWISNRSKLSGINLVLRASKPLALTAISGFAITALSGCGGLIFNGSGATTRGSGSSNSTISLSLVSCGTQSLTGAQSKGCSVYLTADATNATVVKLKSSNATLKVPSAVTVSAGAKSTGFDAVATSVSKAVSVTITATSGVITKTAVITLYPSQLPTSSVALSKVSCGTTSLTGPTTKACSVYLSGAATSATQVTLSSSNAGLQVQPSVTVPAGSLSAGFGVTALAVSSTQSATLTATASGISQTDVIQLVGSGGSATQHHVHLTWSPPSSSPAAIVGYNVYRAVAGSSYQRLNPTTDTSTSYSDGTVQSGVSYDYEVTSLDAAGMESAPSSQTSVTIP